MTFCPSCGKELSAEESTAKFCAHCGAPLATQTAEEPVNETVSDAQPEPAKALTFQESVDDIKEKVGYIKDKSAPVLNSLYEKVKNIPVLGPIVEKVGQKLFPVLLAIPVALIVLILIIVISSSNGSYKDPINDYLKLVNKESTNYEKLSTAMMPDFRVKLWKNVEKKESKSDDYEDNIEDFIDEQEEIYEEINDEFDKWSIKFDIKSKDKLDKDDREDLKEAADNTYDYLEDVIDNLEDILDDKDDLEDYADNLDMSKSQAKKYLKAMIKYYKSFEDVKISEAYEVKGKFIIKADDEEWESEYVRLIVVKVNGDWCYQGLADGESIEFEDDDEEIALFYPLISRYGRIGNYNPY